MQDNFEQQLVAVRPDLYRFARKLSGDHDQAEDLVSSTMIKALRYRDRFQLGSNMRAWTMFILRNDFLSGMRRRKFEGGSADDLIIACPAPQGFAIDLADTLKAVAELPRDQREAVLLVGAGASYEEAAEEMFVSVGTIKSRVARGRDALRELLA